MAPETRRTVWLLFWVLLASGAVGAVIAVSRASLGATLQDILLGALTGVIIGFGGTLTELLAFSNSGPRIMRQVPVIVILSMRAGIYSAFILFGLTVPALIAGLPLPWMLPDFTEVFVMSAVVAFAFSTGVEIMRLLGAEATLALFTGRYIRPRLEQRVILFADLVGSTALAEKIGELEFHAFLQDVALDLAGPIERTRGGVHRYVGDAVIVTWALAKGTKDAACLTCAIQMHETLKERAPRYQARFGAVPKLRVAVHCGQVAAGEIGDWKKEISLLGDAMNTAARIEGAARDLGAATVLSEDVVRRFPQEVRNTLTQLPAYQAHGKQSALTLWTVDHPD